MFTGLYLEGAIMLRSSPSRAPRLIILFFRLQAVVRAVLLETQHKVKVVRVDVDDWVDT